MLGISLVGTNGDVIPFEDETVVTQGFGGIGISPTVLTLLEGAGDGAVFRYSRRGPRDIALPLVMFGDRATVELMQDRIVAALRFDPVTDAVPAQLMFTRMDGSVFQIGVHYLAGGETTYGADAGPSFCRWPLVLRCPDPYWTATDEQSFTLNVAGVVRGLLPRLAKLQVSSSQVLGTVTVNNPGTVKTPILWEIHGPGSAFTATAPSGQSFTLNATLVTGDVRFVDTSAASVTDAAGANCYAELATAPKLFPLPPGRSSLSVLLTGATSDSQVIGRYRPKRELVF